MSNTTKCEKCGEDIQFGQFPFCPHGYMAGREPRQFQPIVVHRTTAPDGSFQYSYPGRADDPVPAGYEKVELSTLSQADQFVKDRNEEERELRRLHFKGEQEYWQERANDRRAIAKSQLEERLGKSNSRIGDMVARAVDARRKKKLEELANRDTNFHIQALSFDKNNQSEYRDDSKRKISVVVNGLRR
jgi:hypothetical protein